MTPEDGTETARRFWLQYSLASFCGIFLLPPLVYLFCLLTESYGLGASLDALLAQYSAERRNLLLVGLPAVAPFALLALALGLYRRWRGAVGSGVLAIGGVTAIVLTLLWANLTTWPLFLPGKSYPGFPHGLEMVIAPLFFAPVAMVFGLLLGWAGMRR